MSCTAIVVISIIALTILALVKYFHQAALLEKNPEAYKTLKEVEAKEKERKEAAKAAQSVVGLNVLSWLLKRK